MVYILTTTAAFRVSVKTKFEYITAGFGKFPSSLNTSAGGVGVNVGEIVGVWVIVRVGVIVKVGLEVYVCVGVKLGKLTAASFEWRSCLVFHRESIYAP